MTNDNTQQDQETTRAAYTITEFCTAHRIGRSFFYQLASEGRAPRVMKVGRRRLIEHQKARYR